MESLTPMAPELLVATCTSTGTMLFRNEVWATVFGVDDDPWRRLSAQDRDLVHQYLTDAGSGKMVTNEILMAHIPNRYEPLPVLLNFLPVHKEDPGAAVVTITGEALAEPSTWMQSQTQRHRLEALGRMTMGIAHDFNNLLSGILGHTELLRTALDEQDAHPLTEHVDTIERAAMDGAALVRKIQQYIRQEKLTTFVPLDLTTLVRDCVTLTRPYWYNEPRRQGIAIECDLYLTEVPAILGVASELRDVIVNLILNAVQAMPDGGQITFRTSFDDTEGVILHVQDTGAGMSEQVQSRIFEPLFTTKGDGGTGMGLAVSYGTVQEHSGTISVASALGDGTTFTLTFPPAEARPPTQPKPQRPAETPPARILIVDDEEMVRSVLRRLLKLKGHTIAEASSGPSALRLLANQSFDLIFTDHGMPEMSGREFAALVRRQHPDLPIVLLTGDTEVGEADEVVSAVVAKPFKLDQLQRVIQQLMNQN